MGKTMGEIGKRKIVDQVKKNLMYFQRNYYQMIYKLFTRGIDFSSMLLGKLINGSVI